MPWMVDGIEETRFRGLAYNAPTETLLASFEREVATRHIVGSVYARRRTETEYRKLFGPDDYTSADNLVVTAEAAPVAYFLVWSLRRDDPSGFDWKALARVDLEALTVSLTLERLAGEWDGAWISGIDSVSADGKTLTCVVGNSRLRSSGNGHSEGAKVGYFLSRLDVSTGAVEPITLLQNTFF